MGRRDRAASVSSNDSFASTKEKKKHRSEKRGKKKHDKKNDARDSLSRSPDRSGRPVLAAPQLAAGAYIPPPQKDQPVVAAAATTAVTVDARIEELRRQAELARAALQSAQAANTFVEEEPADDGDDASSLGLDSDDDYGKLFDSPNAADADAEKDGDAADDDGDDDEGAGFSKLLQFAKAVGGASRGDATIPPPPPPNKDIDDDEPQIVDDGDEDVHGASTTARQVAKPKLLKEFDHSSYDYPPFKRDFFIPPRDVAKLTEEQVKELYVQLDGAKVTGKAPPPPIKTWVGIGLNEEAMNALATCHFEGPFAVQSIAIPILMSGRDLLAIAKTGSGKTLAYLLPLLRHCHAQPRCTAGEGPIGLVLVPTHELADQIFHLAKKLADAMNLSVLPAYGGISLRDSIGHCKAGCDIVVATPGRLFDLLVSNRGRVMNLRRCTFVVIDEADRMFDEGFSGHVAAFLGQIRPDRQVAMVSSTMPMEVYKMAKRFLAKDYLELSVGGRPSPSSNVKQTIEFFDPLPDDADPATLDPRTKRLLQLLGEGGNKLVLVFVAARDMCDRLHVCLSDRGYGGQVATLYSGMDQMDREYALQRFAFGEVKILIATGVAERGVDILDLDLVVNYSMPDHYEAYVNRIGRTGRAGRKGRAITFLQRGTQDEHMAHELVKGLEQSNNDVPEELKTMAEQLKQKTKNGLIRYRSNYNKGYGKSKGFTFSSREGRREEKEVARAMGLADYMSGDDDLDYNSDEVGVIRKRRDPTIFAAMDDETNDTEKGGAMSNALTVVSAPGRNPALDRLMAARQLADNLNLAAEQEAMDSVTSMKQARYDVNDFGDRLRKRIINRRYLDEVSAETDTSITVKGVYKAKPHMHPGKDSLHLEIRGKEDTNITRVFRKFDELIEEITAKANRAGGGGGFGGGGKTGFDGKKSTF